MVSNKKIMEVYNSNKASKVVWKKVAERYGVDRRRLSYMSTIEKMCSEEEFGVVCKAISAGRYVSTSGGERTKSLESLVRILKGGAVVVDVCLDSVVVYFLRSAENVKIGVARSISNRISALQVGNPCKLVLLAEVRFYGEELARAAEKCLCSKYEDKSVQGGWFKLSDKEVAAAVEYLRGEVL